MNLFGNQRKLPTPDPRPMKVDQRKSIRARDEFLKGLSKMRRATMASQLTTPNVKRKVLGAGV